MSMLTDAAGVAISTTRTAVRLNIGAVLAVLLGIAGLGFLVVAAFALHAAAGLASTGLACLIAEHKLTEGG